MFDYYFLGFIQLLIGLFFTFSPPKKPNDMYGYWGKAAKKSLDHWKGAHRTSGPLFILGGLLGLASGYYFQHSVFEYARSTNLFIGIGLGIAVILVTERKLKSLSS
jgi:hypothetical protein